MSKQTIYKKEPISLVENLATPLNPATRDRVSELQKVVYDIKKTLNIVVEKIDMLNLTIDNFVPKETDYMGTWNIGVTGETTTEGMIHVKTLKDTVTITGTIPNFNFVEGTTAITFTAEDTLPTESDESKLTEKSITLTTPSGIDPFIGTINSAEGILLSFTVPATAPTADTLCTFPELNLTYTSTDEEETA